VAKNSFPLLLSCQSCQIFLVKHTNTGEIYQITTTKYTKLPQNIPNGRKIYQMTIKYKNFHSNALQICVFWYENIHTIWQRLQPRREKTKKWCIKGNKDKKLIEDLPSDNTLFNVFCDFLCSSAQRCPTPTPTPLHRLQLDGSRPAPRLSVPSPFRPLAFFN
jgi:hypothetical protein